MNLFEISNLSQKRTGLDNIIIWVGADPKRHTLRVKISNSANRWDPDDNFTITLPKLDVVGNIDKQFISGKMLKNIKSWIKLNIKELMDYENALIDTDVFLDSLVKVY